MRAFVIVDASKRKSKPIGLLTWKPHKNSRQGRFALELSSDCDLENLPLSLGFCTSHGSRRATSEESESWVRSRIVPEDRHNIVEVLHAHGLSDYDEVSLLAACKGRSSDDDLLAYEVELPAELAKQTSEDGETILASGADGAPSQPWVDRVLASTRRQRVGSTVRYAVVSLPARNGNENDTEADSAIQPTAGQRPAQLIGAAIRSERRAQNLTQKQLAARAGITQTVLSRVESGAGNPTLELLDEIAAALGLELTVDMK